MGNPIVNIVLLVAFGLFCYFSGVSCTLEYLENQREVRRLEREERKKNGGNKK